MSAPKSIGLYIKALYQSAQMNITLGERFQTSEDQEHYALWIREKAYQKSITHTDYETCDIRYKRTLKLLDKLQEHRGCGTGINRSLWHSLQIIVKILAHKADWTNLDHGPIFGGRNITIADRLGLSVDRTKKILKALREYGLIVFHQRHANGQRYIKRMHNGHLIAHGLSLMPLVLRLEEFETLANNWIKTNAEAKMTYRKIEGQIVRLRHSLKSAKIDYGSNHPTQIHLKSIESAAKTLIRENKHEELTILSHELANYELFPVEKITPEEGVNDPPHINLHSNHLYVDANKNSSDKIAALENRGIRKIDVLDDEIVTLFPASAHYITERKNILKSAQHLARDLHIDSQVWQLLADKIGHFGAIISTFIVADRLSNGSIHTTPNAYAKGMLRAAERGKLNLDRSIWWQREQIKRTVMKT
jgi:hypothetical protein